MSIEVFYDIISPYAYLGMELLSRHQLSHEQEITITPISLGSVLGATNNPGPANIAPKRKVALFDVCLQCRRHDVEILGPPAHPFIPLTVLRFIHSINDQQERFRMALHINKLCWKEGKAVDSEESLISALEDSGELKEEWRDLRGFIKQGAGRKKLKEATQRALDLDVFGVPTFRYNDINFWGSDRLELLDLYIKDPSQFANTNYERMINLPSGM